MTIASSDPQQENPSKRPISTGARGRAFPPRGFEACWRGRKGARHKTCQGQVRSRTNETNSSRSPHGLEVWRVLCSFTTGSWSSPTGSWSSPTGSWSSAAGKPGPRRRREASHERGKLGLRGQKLGPHLEWRFKLAPASGLM